MMKVINVDNQAGYKEKPYQHAASFFYGGFMKYLLFFSVILGSVFQLTRKKSTKDERDLANEYFPVQSDSERAQDHPIVGAS